MHLSGALSVSAGRVLLRVRVQPRASRNGIVGFHPASGAPRVRIKAPPVDGAANRELLRFLARRVLGVAPSRLSVVRGSSGRDKVIAIEAALDPVQRALEDHLRR